MSLCKKANHQLYNIRHIRNYINKNTCRILINSLVFSIIDFCNSILVGLPKSSLIPINRIIRSSVRLIHRQPRTDHTNVSIKMRRDHILSTSQRSKYKLLCIIHKTMRIGQPAYIRSCLNIIQPRRTLRSNNDTTRLSVRRTLYAYRIYLAPEIELSPTRPQIGGINFPGIFVVFKIIRRLNVT